MAATFLAFHDASVPSVTASVNGRLFDKLIAWHQGSPYVHAELVLDASDLESAECFSSTPAQGVRIARINLMEPWWKIVRLPAAYTAEKLRPLAERYIGQKYDWVGIIGFLCPRAVSDKFPDLHVHLGNQKFCDEVLFDVLRDAGMFTGVSAWAETPADLYRMVTV